MTSLTIRATTALLLLLTCNPARAGESGDNQGLALPASCASVQASGLRQLPAPADGFEATRYHVRLPGGDAKHGASLSAALLRVTSEDAVTTDAALERAASAAAAALLVALTGDKRGGCQTAMLRDAAAPVAAGLRQTGAYVATWQGVTLRGASGQVTARRMRLRLRAAPGKAGDHPVQVAFTLDGVTGKLTPPTLLPDTLALRVTLPGSSLAALLAATGGGAPDARIPLTVDDLHATEGTTVLDATGTAVAAPTPLASSASLQLTARHYDALVNRAAAADLVRLHTVLTLASLIGRQDGDALQWDVTFQDGQLTVNHLPIPMR